MHIKTILALCLLLPMLSVTARAETIPFGPGEQLRYAIHWTFIHAGDAVLEVMPDTDLDGRPARYFKASAKTRPWVDKFYKVRDSMEAWTDMEVSRSLRYKKDQNEGNYHKQVDLIFDPETNRSFRYVRGDLKHTLEQPAEVFDPMSVLFNFRKYRLYKGMRFAVHVTDGKKSVVGEAFVEKKETMSTGIGDIEAWKVRLDVKHLSGVFKKSRDATLTVWFSADDRRIPVRVRSKVAVGHFSLDLEGYRAPYNVSANQERRSLD